MLFVIAVVRTYLLTHCIGKELGLRHCFPYKWLKNLNVLPKSAKYGIERVNFNNFDKWDKRKICLSQIYKHYGLFYASPF